MMAFKGRDISLDIVRGIAIFLVVMQHTGSYINEGIHFMCITDIPLFFIVSGYLVYKPVINVKSFLFRKAKAILLPYIVACMFALLWYDISFTTLMCEIGRRGYWFLQALFLMFCFYALIHSELNSLKKTILAIATLEIVLLLGSKFLPSDLDSYLGTSYLARYFPCFFAGVLIRKYNISESVLKSHYYLGGLICLLVMSFAFTNHFTSNISFLLFVTGYLGSAILLFFFIRSVTPDLPKVVSGFFGMIGRYSLSVYIIHFYFLWKIPSYFGSFVPDLIVTVIVSFVIVVASLCVSKVLTYATPLKNILPN